jgi:hypothetical protein
MKITTKRGMPEIMEVRANLHRGTSNTELQGLATFS